MLPAARAFQRMEKKKVSPPVGGKCYLNRLYLAVYLSEYPTTLGADPAPIISTLSFSKTQWSSNDSSGLVDFALNNRFLVLGGGCGRSARV